MLLNHIRFSPTNLASTRGDQFCNVEKSINHPITTSMVHTQLPKFLLDLCDFDPQSLQLCITLDKLEICRNKIEPPIHALECKTVLRTSLPSEEAGEP
ncbi:hypothetical protein [Pseudomonas sp. Irchel 3F3]|uniref:hypothetical protein n=1 Tax=Pseudomonas sp. Irchel 3F3 TaxID=2009000 RepID=UPI002113C15E|nr:hypothetical protein [Pseudomonas sp. Irchel 3F3]